MSSLPLFPWHTILAWHEKNGRHDLPWRRYFHLSAKDLGYHVWLAEIILQQTQASRAIAYYERILKQYPTIESLSRASYEEFFEYYKGLGYYSRARNMLKTAKIVSETYEWIFPWNEKLPPTPLNEGGRGEPGGVAKNTQMEANKKALQSLPGVGPYTAAAILAFAYEYPILSLDTNLLKIFARYYHGSRFAKLSKDKLRAIEEEFCKSGISGRTINAALMDFASMVSVNNIAKIDWENYPMEDCEFYCTRGTLEIAPEKARTIFPIRDARIVVTLHENHRIYYSSQSDRYAPFILPPSEWDIRHFVQTYFRDTYGLEVSVRPIHAKYYEDGAPFVACNAQVQRGENPFREYKKEETNSLLR